MDLVSQSGINIIITVKKSVFHDIPSISTWWVGTKFITVLMHLELHTSVTVIVRVEHSKIYISAHPYINISRLRIHTG